MSDPDARTGAEHPDDRDHAPHWSRGRIAVAGFLIMSAIGAVDALFNIVLVGDLRASVEIAAVTWPAWVILGLLLPVPLFMGERFPVAPGRWARAFVIHAPVAAAFAFTHIALAVFVSDVVLTPIFARVGWRAMTRALSNYFVMDMVLYAGVLVTWYALAWRRGLHEQTTARARLEAALARANLHHLRMQLNPHFLFNALNLISGTALRRNPEQAATLIASLSSLLRRSLRVTGPTVPLEEEVRFLEEYLRIERARMGPRLRTSVTVEPGLETAPVPALLLQPLVENAVRHGVSQRTGSGRIDVEARRAGAYLRIVVRDTGGGFPGGPGAVSPPEQGVGLDNTRAVLEALYGERGSLTLRNLQEGGAEVEVRIPVAADASR